MKQRLADLGVFSLNLADYSKKVQAKIIDGIIENGPEGRVSSYYFSQENPYLEENRRVIAVSKQMRDYLFGMGVYHVGDIKAKHATMFLGHLFGFKKVNSKQMQKRLVDLGTFSQRLTDYSPQILEVIIEDAIENVSKADLKSPYLAEGNPYLEENRRVIAVSKQMKDYLLSIGVHHLDDVRNQVATGGLGGILGFKGGYPIKMKQRLAEFGVFSPNLADSSYDGLRENICQKILDNLSKPRKPSFYTSNVDEQTLQSNREVILASNAVQRFFAEQGYNMDDPSTMTNKVRLFFKKYLGAEG